MSHRIDAAPGSRDTLETAAQWLLRLRAPEVTDQEVLAWLAWYEQHDAHRRAFDSLQTLWRASGQLAVRADGLAQLERLQRGPFWRRWQRAGRRRIEAAIAVFGAHGPTPLIPARLLLRIGAGVVTAAVVGALFVSIAPPAPRPYAAASRAAEPITSAPLVSALHLPDRSQVQFAPHTHIVVAYSAGQRRLDMSDGEADFIVAHNKRRPFVVHVDGLRVRAVGTQFNIRRADDRVVVTVIEGRIEVSPESPARDRQGAESPAAQRTIALGAGQQLTALPGTSAVLAAADPGGALAWREGRLHYVDEPLASVIADINRYVTRPIVIRDDELKNLTYTGTVFVQSIDEWLDAIPKEFPLVVIGGVDRTLLVGRRHDAAASSAPLAPAMAR